LASSRVSLKTVEYCSPAIIDLTDGFRVLAGDDRHLQSPEP
jgi:hypothetical protein